MTIEIDVDGSGIDEIVAGFRELAERSENLRPLGWHVRARWLESERRHLTSATFAPRKASTLRRYRWKLTSMSDEQGHLTPGRGPLNRHGLLFRTLTVQLRPGQLDEIKVVRGGLDARFGVKNKGPVAYGGMQPQGGGGRRARDPFSFDRIAHLEATGDVVDYLIARHSARR